jgi:hypothetical protein
MMTNAQLASAHRFAEANRANAHPFKLKAQAQDVRAAQWAQANPAEYEWLVNHCDTNPFAGSLHASLHKWGGLTPKQHMAVQGAIARAKIAQDKAQNAPTVTVEPIEVAFGKATAAGIARPKLRLGEFVFSPAPATGKNPGAIYVKHSDGSYLGKVAGSRLFTVSSVSPAVEAEIVGVAADPLNAAIAYGKRYGKCSVCARTLTDEASIARGIGPVCAERFGW